MKTIYQFKHYVWLCLISMVVLSGCSTPSIDKRPIPFEPKEGRSLLVGQIMFDTRTTNVSEDDPIPLGHQGYEYHIEIVSSEGTQTVKADRNGLFIADIHVGNDFIIERVKIVTKSANIRKNGTINILHGKFIAATNGITSIGAMRLVYSEIMGYMHQDQSSFKQVKTAFSETHGNSLWLRENWSNVFVRFN
jgi:hypothetical protein